MIPATLSFGPGTLVFKGLNAVFTLMFTQSEADPDQTNIKNRNIIIFGDL